MVKINQQAGSLRIARERNALALLRDASVLRVPEYIGDGDDWIVMSRLPGDVPGDASHPPEQISPELGAQLGALTAQLHNGPRPPGFGTWTDRDYSLRDEYEVRVTALHGLGVDYKIVERSELDAVRDLLLAGRRGRQRAERAGSRGSRRPATQRARRPVRSAYRAA